MIDREILPRTFLSVHDCGNPYQALARLYLVKATYRIQFFWNFPLVLNGFFYWDPKHHTLPDYSRIINQPDNETGTKKGAYQRHFGHRIIGLCSFREWDLFFTAGNRTLALSSLSYKAGEQCKDTPFYNK
jgi:hypothetical protein